MADALDSGSSGFTTVEVQVLSSAPYCVLAIGKWLSLVEHHVRDVGVAGSNPVFPTIHSIIQGFDCE